MEQDLAVAVQTPNGRRGLENDDTEVSSFANKKRSTDELDPLGTSEGSGSGEIIIYRNRNGEIEGTSETHEQPKSSPE